MTRIRLRAVVLINALILVLPLSGCWSAGTEETLAPAQTTGDKATMDSFDTLDSIEPSLNNNTQHSQTLTILFVSDTQPDPENGDYTGFGELLSQALEMHESPDIVIFGGDTVNDGGDEAEWGEFRQIAGKWLDGLKTAAVAGNHDNYPLLSGQFDYPDKELEGRSDGYFYTLSMGPMFFIMLDSNIMGAANKANIEWLQSELQSEAALLAEWNIVVMHHPMWPVTDNAKDIQRAETMRENFLPLMEESNVSLILCGHQHVYSCTLPMHGDSAAEGKQGIVQIMAASGDKATYAVAGFGYIASSVPAPNYLLLTVDGENLTVTAFDGEGRVIDQVAISK